MIAATFSRLSFKNSLAIAITVFFISLAGTADAQTYQVPRLFTGTRTAIGHNGFSPTIVAVGRERETIKSMHILDRPYRPFHFYGNAVRRRHFRQSF